MPRETSSLIEWRVSDQLVPYDEALSWMNARAAAIANATAPECIWLLEHPPLYTAGTSADPRELIDARFPVFPAGRGGRYTYHGPGQRVGYVMIDLNARGRDVRMFVHAVEDWVIAALAQIGVDTWRVDERVGIWTRDGGTEAKIGAIGIRVRRWVSLHGFSINLAPDLHHFDGIVPCGLPDFPVTSLQKLGISADMDGLDDALAHTLPTFLAGLAP